MSKSSENKVGRPTIINENVVKILEDALKDGSTVSQACYIAQIGRQVFYNHIREDVEFLYRMNTARNYLQLRALKNVSDAIKKGDLKTSAWFLERCVPIEMEDRRQESNNIETEVKPVEKELDLDALEKEARSTLEAIDSIKGRGRYALLNKLGSGENRVIEGEEVSRILNNLVPT